jgi:pilus assembly protein Flp/PilA
MPTKVVALLRAVRLNRAAVTAMEYGLIASIIAVLIVGSVRSLGTSTSTTFNKVATSL